MDKITCSCGHLESDHSEFTRGYATDSETGKTHCYDCSLKADLAYLKKNGKLTAYVSSDKNKVTTWPGLKIANIVAWHTVDFGYCRDQISFNAILEDGTKVVGRGPGGSMYCRLRVVKNFS